MKDNFDLAVIGAGPGGYVAAIKAAQMGLRVALIEKKSLGGTCLNVGCIPSKTLLSNAQIYSQIKKANTFGIQTGPVSFDYAKMKSRKDSVIEKILSGLEGLIKTNGITIFKGCAQFISPKELKIQGEKNTLIHAEKIIIASGSEPIDIPAFPCDHKKILNSTSALELTTLPKTLTIIGGGYIGCEFASLFAELGVKVTIIEALPSIVQAQGKDISTALSQAFSKKGIEILCNLSVTQIDKTKEALHIHLSNEKTLTCDLALVSVGRRLNSEGLGLEKAGVQLGKKGEIPVNHKMETNVPGIYAIGDVTAQSMLAHVASHQGIVAATNACGGESYMHYHAIPAVIFTHPEIACVGMTHEDALAKGYSAKVGKFPLQILGKAVAAADTEGFAQVITDQKTGEILGAQVVGHEASCLIAEMALAINNELTLDCVLETVHAHPTLPEAWLEAAFIANDTPIHFPPKIKKS